jgi:hypothetical protein
MSKTIIAATIEVISITINLGGRWQNLRIGTSLAVHRENNSPNKSNYSNNPQQSPHNSNYSNNPQSPNKSNDSNNPNNSTNSNNPTITITSSAS